MLLTNSILQAHGKERVPIVTMIIGGTVKVAINWFLVGNPAVGIKAAPVSTLVCYALVSVLNLAAVYKTVAEKPHYVSLFAKPAFCTVLMGAAAKLSYQLLAGLFGNAISVFGSICVAVVIYGICVLLFRVITREDLILLPKGEKIAKILRI